MKKLVCPTDSSHNRFRAYVVIKGHTISDAFGELKNIEFGPGPEFLTITRFEPDICAVCNTPLYKGETWHSQETQEELSQRIINAMAFDEEEIKDFNLEDYRCGLCSRLYDKCNCARTGMR